MDRIPISVTTENNLISDMEQTHTLWMLLQGEIVSNLGTETFRMTRGDVLFIPAGMVITSTARDALAICMTVEESFLSEYIHPEANQIRCNSALEPGNYTPLRQCISELALSLTAGGQERQLHTMAVCYELLSCLTGFCVPIPQEPERQRKLEIERYIRQHYREPLSLSGLAEVFYLSPQYLSRYIKTAFGQGFLAILTGVRLDAAVRELREGKSSVTQAALNHGFPNVSSFNSAFRNRYGLTPRNYLKTLEQPDARKTAPEDTSLLAAQLEEFLPRQEATEKDHEILRSVEVDCAGQSAYRPSWQAIINLEQASSLLDNAFQDHVRKAQERLHFTYGRIVNLIGPEVFPGIEERGLSNFTQLNRIIDFLLSVKLKPFIELQPKQVRKPVSADTMRVREPFSISESNWNRYMHAFFSYLCKRWGEEEVETWRFELWLPHNEALEITSMEIRRYIRRFQITSDILKSYIPEGKLGGPGLNLGGSPLRALEDVLKAFEEQGIEADFYSAYLFPAYLGHTSGDQVTFSRIIGGDVENWPELLRAFRETVGGRGTELFLTEFGTDVTCRAWLNDTGYKAAVLVKSFMRLGDLVDGMGYWYLSDLSYDVMESNILLFGGNGMISRNGIPKSVFYAFTFLARQGKHRIDLGENYMVTRRNHRHYEVLVHNCKALSEHYRQAGFALDMPETESVFADVRPLRLRLTLDGLRPGKYTVQKYAIQQHYGDLSAAVQAFGCPFVMREEEREYLLHTSVPKQTMEDIDCDGKLPMDILLGPNEIALYTLVFDD